MNRLKLVLLAFLAVLGGCRPYFINTEARLSGYCSVQAIRLSSVSIFEKPDSLVAFKAEAKKNGVRLTQHGDSLICSAIVYR